MFRRRFRYWAILLAILFLGIGGLLSSWMAETAKPPIPIESPLINSSTVELFQEPVFQPVSSRNLLSQAVRRAEQTAGLAQTARSAEEWDEVARGWAAAITLMQSLPAGDPKRVFAQRKAKEYVSYLIVAQQRAAATSFPKIYPSLGSPILDEQLVVYLSYVATVGVPDVLIIGSSRSLQGVDPQILQQALATAGYPGVKAFNFGVNGATAQVVDFILQRLLSPDQLPKLILWAGGSRAFNSGRRDRTFTRILDSPGYRALATEETRPTLEPPLDIADSPSTAMAIAPPITTPALSNINAYGFLPIEEQFDPASYYCRHPRVEGRYDGAYQSFNLRGIQTRALESIVGFTQAQGISLGFVNLPLSQAYLDPVRLRLERRFQTFLQQQSRAQGFLVIDLLQQWTGQNALYADPSHLNRTGAALLARQLASSRQIPWDDLKS
ncbi:MAG: hypothetical protein QNJ46_19120 [Leptolyngbyaceae cyanobacterium MO_188.B28]|nr:hypothetical protein [Leptolyngbyaceae cyanobacterium MO_188.B28]